MFLFCILQIYTKNHKTVHFDASEFRSGADRPEKRKSPIHLKQEIYIYAGKQTGCVYERPRITAIEPASIHGGNKHLPFIESFTVKHKTQVEIFAFRVGVTQKIQAYTVFSPLRILLNQNSGLAAQGKLQIISQSEAILFWKR